MALPDGKHAKCEMEIKERDLNSQLAAKQVKGLRRK